MPAIHQVLPGLPGYQGPDAFAALADYAATLHRLAGLSGPPYDPRRMAEALGVRVRPAPTYDGARGLLVPLRDGSYQIVVRAGETEGAQRFTVAHELMELGLQVGCPTLVERSYRDVGAGRAKERFCEAGAAEILMPLERVRREMRARPEGIAALPRLATLFGASLHAMLWRMAEAAERPCVALIVCEERHVVRGASPQGAGRPTGTRQVAAASSGLVVRAACGGGGPWAPVPIGTAIPPSGVLAACHQLRTDLCATEQMVLGRLRGRFRVEATCPGRGERRHVYALLQPC